MSGYGRWVAIGLIMVNVIIETAKVFRSNKQPKKMRKNQLRVHAVLKMKPKTVTCSCFYFFGQSVSILDVKNVTFIYPKAQ